MNYKRVDIAPKTLKKNQAVIYEPDFMLYIRKVKDRSLESNVTTLNTLRNILIEIGNDYDPMFSAYKINISNFVGLPYKDKNELSKIIFQIISEQCPEIINKFIDAQISKVGVNVNFFYFVANDMRYTSSFTLRNIRLIDEDSATSQENTTEVVDKQ